MPITAAPDHVAVAVRSIDAAAERWVDQLHGVWLSPRFEGGGFGTRQVRYGNTGKLELLEPATDDGFATSFLDRFGPRMHHVTLKVSDLREALRVVEAAGFDTVDVSYVRDEWHEAFLRPTQVGGLIVQLARAAHTDAGWAQLAGVELAAPHPQAPALAGPTLVHTDLDRAGHVWSTLGATLTADGDDAFVATWPDAVLDVRVERGEHAGPRGLRFTPDPGLPTDEVAGPATLPA